MQSARAHSRSKKPFISDNIPPCFTKKLKNKIKSSTNISVSKFWIRDLGVLLLVLVLLLVQMRLLLGGAHKFRCQMRFLQSRAPFAPKLGLHDWRPAWCPKLRLCGGTCRNTWKATFSLRKKLWETLRENGWMKNRKKKHRTDDKRSPKVYYYVPYRGLLHLLVSTMVSILVATSLTHPGIRDAKTWDPGLVFFSLNSKLILVLKNRPSLGVWV